MFLHAAAVFFHRKSFQTSVWSAHRLLVGPGKHLLRKVVISETNETQCIPDETRLLEVQKTSKIFHAKKSCAAYCKARMFDAFAI